MVSILERPPTLVGFTIGHDGAQMACHYCGAMSTIGEHNISAQILLFQENHFGCDPDADAAGGA